MSSVQRQADHEMVIDSDFETVFDLVANVERWPQFHPSAVHAAVLHSNEKGDLIQYWSLIGDSAVRTWRSVHRTDPPAHRITFTHVDVSTINPSALSLLGNGTTVAEARRFLRRLLSSNSMSNLRLAKAFAEERADSCG